MMSSSPRKAFSKNVKHSPRGRNDLGDGFDEHFEKATRKRAAKQERGIKDRNFTSSDGSKGVEHNDEDLAHSERVKRRRVIHDGKDARESPPTSCSRAQEEPSDSKDDYDTVGGVDKSDAALEQGAERPPSNVRRQFNLSSRSQPHTDRTSLSHTRMHFVQPSRTVPRPVWHSSTLEAQSTTSKPKPAFLRGPKHVAPQTVQSTPQGASVPGISSTGVGNSRHLQPTVSILPEAFSPHKRRDRFLPAGWASQVRSWVIEASSGLDTGRDTNRCESFFSRIAGQVVRVVERRGPAAAATGNCSGIISVRAALVSSGRPADMEKHTGPLRDEFSVLLIGSVDGNLGINALETETKETPIRGSLIRLGQLGWDVPTASNETEPSDGDSDGRTCVCVEWRVL